MEHFSEPEEKPLALTERIKEASWENGDTEAEWVSPVWDRIATTAVPATTTATTRFINGSAG